MYTQMLYQTKFNLLILVVSQRPAAQPEKRWRDYRSARSLQNAVVPPQVPDQPQGQGQEEDEQVGEHLSPQSCYH